MVWFNICIPEINVDHPQHVQFLQNASDIRDLEVWVNEICRVKLQTVM